MQNEKNSNKGWKEKLEEAGSFPLSPVSKELAWQKLSNRLGEKKRRKKAVGYWVGAACLLPLMVFVLMFRNEHQQPSVATDFTHKPSVTQPSVDTPLVQKQREITAAAQPPIVKKTESPKAKQAEAITKADDKNDIPSIDSSTTSNVATVIVADDTAANIATLVQPQKKKLKVVHINELGEPYESLPAMAHNTYYPKLLPLQIARESIYPEPVKTAASTGFINLKNKSSN